MQKRKALFAGVVSSMAVVVGLWGFSLRNLIRQKAPEGNDAAFRRAYAELQKSRDQFVETFKNIPSADSPGSRATSSKQSAVINDLKNRLMR